MITYRCYNILQLDTTKGCVKPLNEGLTLNLLKRMKW